MSGFNYVRSRETASRLVKRFGTTANILRAGEWSGPEHRREPGADVAHACNIVWTEFNALERSQSLVEAQDRKAVVSVEGLTITPTVEDKLQYDGADYAVLRVSPISPGVLVVGYELHVRR